MIYLHYITYFVNLLNNIIQLPIFLTGYFRIVYSLTFLGIQETSLILIFGPNLMGVVKMDWNLHII